MYNKQELMAIFGLTVLLIPLILAFGINDIGVASFLIVIFGVLLFGILIRAIKFSPKLVVEKDKG